MNFSLQFKKKTKDINLKAIYLCNSYLHKLNCDGGTPKQTVDRVLVECPTHQALHGARGVTALDDDTHYWLNTITASI